MNYGVDSNILVIVFKLNRGILTEHFITKHWELYNSNNPSQSQCLNKPFPVECCISVKQSSNYIDEKVPSSPTQPLFLRSLMNFDLLKDLNGACNCLIL